MDWPKTDIHNPHRRKTLAGIVSFSFLFFPSLCYYLIFIFIISVRMQISFFLFAFIFPFFGGSKYVWTSQGRRCNILFYYITILLYVGIISSVQVSFILFPGLSLVKRRGKFFCFVSFFCAPGPAIIIKEKKKRNNTCVPSWDFCGAIDTCAAAAGALGKTDPFSRRDVYFSMNVIKCRFIKGTDQLAYISSRRENKKPQPQQKDKIKTLSTLLRLLSFPSDYLAFLNSLARKRKPTQSLNWHSVWLIPRRSFRHTY